MSLPLNLSNNQHTTPCPGCGGAAKVLSTGLFCVNSSCEFRAGSVIDAFAWKTGGYEGAIDRWKDVFLDRLPYFSAWAPETLRNTLSRAFFTRRQAFAIVRNTLFSRQTESQDVMLTASWLKARGVDVELFPESIGVVEKRDWGSFAAFLRAQEADFSWTPDGPLLLFPYFRTPHTVNRIVLADKNRNKYFDIDLSLDGYSFFGLNDALMRDARDVEYCASPFDAASRTCEQHLLHPDRFCLAPLAGLSLPVRHWMPSGDVKFVYQERGNHGQVTLASRLYRKWSSIRIVIAGEFEQESLSWPEFFHRRFIGLCRENQLTDAAVDFYNAAQPETNLRLAVCDEFRRRGWMRALAAFEERFTSTLVYSQDRFNLYETEAGWSYSKGDDATRQRVTNFHFHLDANIIFADSAETYHKGILKHDGHDSPIILPASSLENAGSLEQAARMAAVQGGSTSLPVVLQKNPVKGVLQYLRQGLTLLPCIEGVSSLGWSIDNEKYHAPGWLTEKGVWKSREAHFHPGRRWFKGFSGAPSEMGVLSDLPTEVCDVLSQMAAMITRYYFRHPVYPVYLVNTPETSRALEAIFAGLGQHRPIDLTPSQRSTPDFNCVRGFPVYGRTQQKVHLERSLLSAFVICDAGYRLPELSADVLQSASIAALRVVTDVVSWLFKTKGEGYRRNSSVLYDMELLREGDWCLRQACALTEWPRSQLQYDTLEGVLRSITADVFRSCFEHDLAEQKVRFFPDKVPGRHDFTELELDLRRLCKDVTVRRDRWEIDSVSAMTLLENFYQQIPAMPTIAPSEISGRAFAS